MTRKQKKRKQEMELRFQNAIEMYNDSKYLHTSNTAF